MVNLDASEFEIRYGLQRIGGRLVHGEHQPVLALPNWPTWTSRAGNLRRKIRPVMSIRRLVAPSRVGP